MKKRYVYTLCVCGLLVCVSALAFCRPVADDDGDIRISPEIEYAHSINSPARVYPYINYGANRVEFNGSNWTELTKRLNEAYSDGVFTIVHIGDSHIQAEGGTSVTRSNFQEIYGNAGRGIIVPLRIAGTNQPVDYSIQSSDSFAKSTLLKQPWQVPMGFTGVSIRPAASTFRFGFALSDPADCFTVMSSGHPAVTSVESNGSAIAFSVADTPLGICVTPEIPLKDFTVVLTGSDAVIHGFDLRNDRHGVVYHAIGNNGATYASYGEIESFGRSVAALSPDLVIIALGTNDAFGRYDEADFVARMDGMVKDIRSNAPESALLLVTPSECQRSASRRTGRGRRTKVKTYTVNTNIEKVRDAIMRYGAENHIATYDFYTVAGGAGASEKWLADKLLSKDRIHRTWDGYRLDGSLIFEALHNALSEHNQSAFTAR